MGTDTGNASFIGRRRILGGAAGASLLGLVPARASRGLRLGILDRRAPELEVDYWLDRNGEPTTYSLAALRGRWVFLECFQNTCAACHAHGFPTLKKVADAFDGDDRVSVAGVQTVFEDFAGNTREAIRALQIRYALPIPMGHDPGSPDGERLPTTMLNYRSGGTPWIIVIEPGGTVAYNDYRIDGERFIELLKRELG